MLPCLALLALTRGLPTLFPSVETVIEIGGHSPRYVVIEPRTLTLLDDGVNQQYAVGSGSFFEQQAGRLGLDVECQHGLGPVEVRVAGQDHPGVVVADPLDQRPFDVHVDVFQFALELEAA